MHKAGDENYELDLVKRQFFLNWYGVIYMLSILFSVFYFNYMKNKLWQKIQELDQSAFTPSDFCIMGQNIHFGSASPEDIKNELVEYFNENYNGLGDNIVYVNPAYKIGDFYKCSNRYTELTKLKTILEAY